MTRPIAITRARLDRMPLPGADADSDKNSRGRVLAVGGCAKVPGAMLLSGVAALRAGAGKLQLATVASAAQLLGVAVPEALVQPLPSDRSGEITGRGLGVLSKMFAQSDAVLIGPGMSSERAAVALIRAAMKRLSDECVLVLDAGAIGALARIGRTDRVLRGRVIITPHAGEMAGLLGVSEESVSDDPRAAALEAASRFGVVAALKGPESWIADPGARIMRYSGGDVGLATSGSGDTLAGIVAGLAARGADPMRAAAWAVYLHGAAGNALARRMGPTGYLARELLDEIPRVMR